MAAVAGMAVFVAVVVIVCAALAIAEYAKRVWPK
jgi:hypothetical protein